MTAKHEALAWSEVAARAGRNDYPGILFDSWTRLSDTERLVGIERSWVAAEWPLALLDEAVWRQMFEWAIVDGPREAPGFEVGYLHDQWTNDRETLPEQVTLFRGTNGTTGARGWSWSSNPERAHWFASRLGMFSPRAPRGVPAEPHVWMIQADRDAVLARFDGRSEDEWVLDTDLIQDAVLWEVTRGGDA